MEFSLLIEDNKCQIQEYPSLDYGEVIGLPCLNQSLLSLLMPHRHNYYHPTNQINLLTIYRLQSSSLSAYPSQVTNGHLIRLKAYLRIKGLHFGANKCKSNHYESAGDRWKLYCHGQIIQRMRGS